MRDTTNLIGRLAVDTAGNILPLAAGGMLVAAVVVGSAVDLSRQYMVRNQLQSACDAGVLAGRRTVTSNGFDQASRNAAASYFNTNFRPSEHGIAAGVTAFTATSTNQGKTVNGAAATTLDTLIMRLFGFDDFSIRTTCSSTMGIGNADIMMVLDVTGSMNDNLDGKTKMAALQAAMRSFYNTVNAAMSGTTARVRYGFVPYSSTVNVGRLLLDRNPDFIANSHVYQSREWSTSGTKYGNYNSYESQSIRYNSEQSCRNAIDNQNLVSYDDYIDYGNSSRYGNTTTQPQRKLTYQCRSTSSTRWYIYTTTETRDKISMTGSRFWYRPITRDTSQFKRFIRVTTPTASNGGNQNSTWNGCIEERVTTRDTNFTYSATYGIVPSGARDIDIDSAPTTGDATTQWKPQWYQISYTRYDDDGNATRDDATEGNDVDQYCPVAAQLLTQMTYDEFDDYASSLKPIGGTYLDIGMIWGGRLSSPDGIFSANVNSTPSNSGEVSRHVIFMTDGEMDTSNSATSAWGIDWWDRRVSTDGSEGTADARHTSRFLAVCEAIKAKGIRIWTIGFTSKDTTNLRTCASPNSFFPASSADQLNTAFQEIANQVGELRITM